jgi:hypothetical protein
MTGDDYKFVIQTLGSLGIAAVASGAAIYLFLKTFASTYLSEKGKNLATKEDIAKITRTVEEVKSELQARHTFRFAALDRRVLAHQNAYTCARELIRTLPTGGQDFDSALVNCQKFLDENSVFLEAKALLALESANQAGLFLRMGDGIDRKSVVEFRKEILSAPNAIRDALGLPPLKVDNESPSPAT